jgi:hypothetical protein
MPDEIPADEVEQLSDSKIRQALTRSASRYAKGPPVDWELQSTRACTIFGAFLTSRSLERQEKVLNDMSGTIQSQKKLLEDMSATIQNVKKVTGNLLRESTILRWLTIILAVLTLAIVALTCVLAFKS